jgi:hypothetical protein
MAGMAPVSTRMPMLGRRNFAIMNPAAKTTGLPVPRQPLGIVIRSQKADVWCQRAPISTGATSAFAPMMKQ